MSCFSCESFCVQKEPVCESLCVCVNVFVCIEAFVCKSFLCVKVSVPKSLRVDVFWCEKRGILCTNVFM